MSTSVRRGHRPLWVVCLGALVGATLVAAIVAYASYRWFAAILLYPLLLGTAGGLFAWMVVDEVDPALQGGRLLGAVGAVTGAGMYLLHSYLIHRFADAGAIGEVTWWEHLRTTAEAGVQLTRWPGRAGLAVGAPVVWTVRAVELALSTVSGGAMARLVRL